MKNYNEFQHTVEPNEIKALFDKIKHSDIPEINDENLSQLFTYLDITSLDISDNSETIGNLCEKINLLPESYPSLPSPAAVCVYPYWVSLVKKNLNNPLVNIVAAGGGFPSSQTFLEVKVKEIELSLEAGADEIDIVLPVGRFQLDQIEEVFEEIFTIKTTMGSSILKVIIETGVLLDLTKIRKASMLAMAAGADFIKTSTGKSGKGADPESFIVMCQAIKDFYDKTGKKTGIKPAGGVSDVSSAFEYFGIVRSILGEDWLNPEYFRIGASKLANDIMKNYLKKESTFCYFD